MRRKVRRCTTKLSQLPHMRTSISPDPWVVYIPLNGSACIRTFKKVCRSWRGAKGIKGIMHCFTCLKMHRNVRRCTTKFSQLPHLRTSISPDHWLVYIPLNRSAFIRTFKKSAGPVRGAKGIKRHNALFHLFEKASKSAQMYHEILTTSTHAHKYIT